MRNSNASARFEQRDRAELHPCRTLRRTDRVVDSSAQPLVLALLLVACKPIAPPPMVAMHADTSAAPRESTTFMLILGTAGTVLGGGGWGFAIRGEYQATNRTATGLELTAGLGSEADGDKDHLETKHKLFAVRGYGRFTPRTHDWIAATYSLGLTAMDTGLLAMTAHGGTAVSYVNDSASPVLHVGFATTMLLHDGTPFGEPKKTPETDGFVFVDAGLVGKVENGRLTLDAGFAGALESGEIVIGASIGAGNQF